VSKTLLHTVASHSTQSAAELLILQVFLLLQTLFSFTKALASNDSM